jgi:hypothetical protein
MIGDDHLIYTVGFGYSSRSAAHKAAQQVAGGEA